MAEVDWGLSAPYQDPTVTQARAFNYADQIAQKAAAFRSGQQFASGDYSGATATEAGAGNIDQAIKLRDYGAAQQAGAQFAAGDYQSAAKTQAQAGNIDAARNIQDYGVQHFQAQQQYLQRAVPIFTQIYQQAGPNGVLNAFDRVTPDLKTLGVSDDKIAQYRQAFATDPQGTLQSLGALAQHQFQYHTAGDTVFITNENGQLVGRYEGTKFVPVPMGGQLVQTGGDAQAPTPNLGGAPQPQPASGNQPLIPAADPAAMHTVESGNNPNAVSSKGAVGVGQTLPSTLQGPGFGVQPAQNNSPAEQQRVADQYLAALNQHYGNPVLAHIAYNYGPGNTDKWLQAGGDFSKLPAETQQYLGRIAVAQALPRPPQQQQPAAAAAGAPRVVADNHTPVDQEAIDNDVKLWIASKGTINPQYGMGAQGAELRRAFDTAKNRIMTDLGVTPEDVASGQAARKADTQSLQKLQSMSDQIQAFEATANKNADLALQLSVKGGAQGQAPLFNNWSQEYRKWINGDKDVSAFTAALGTFADEYAKVVGGQNGSTDSLRASAYDRINTAMNQGQLQAVVATMKKEMANRTDSNNFQLDTIKARLGDRQAQARLNGTPQQATTNIPAGAVAMLKKNPGLRAQFDQKYGQGAAAQVLGN